MTVAPPSHFKALEITNPLSASIDLLILDISYKRNQAVCGILHLASPT